MHVKQDLVSLLALLVYRTIVIEITPNQIKI